VKIGSGAEGVSPIVGVVGWYDATKTVVTEHVGVRTLTECVGNFTTINTRVHPVEETDRKSCCVFVVEPGAGIPVAGLVGVELEGFENGKGAVATVLGVFVLGVSDKGSTHEVGVETTVSASTN
jgi:hypothetical protein